jgi:hypothetical protein
MGVDRGTPFDEVMPVSGRRSEVGRLNEKDSGRKLSPSVLQHSTSIERRFACSMTSMSCAGDATRRTGLEPIRKCLHS